MDFNSKIDEQIKQYEKFIDKIKDDMVNLSGIPASIFENSPQEVELNLIKQC